MYNPRNFISVLIHKSKSHSFSALGRHLGMDVSTISNIYYGKTCISESHLLRVHEVMNISITELRCIMGDLNLTTYYCKPKRVEGELVWIQET